MLPIITGPASIFPPGRARGSGSGAAQGVRRVLGSAVLLQHPRGTAGEQRWNVQGAGGVVLLLSSQGTARLSWVLSESCPGATKCSCIPLVFPQCDEVPGSCSGTGAEAQSCLKAAFLMSPNPSPPLFYRGVHQGTVRIR